MEYIFVALVFCLPASPSHPETAHLHKKDPYTVSPPVTYLICSLDLEDNSALFESFRHDVPQVLHVSPPFVGITGALGPVRKYFDRGRIGYDRISEEQVLQREAGIRAIIDRLHEAGVKSVIVYLCNQTIGGDPDTRLGFWDFYDHWNEYPRLGLGPKPPSDPIEWMQRHPDGGLHFTYPKEMAVFRPGYRYQPSQNHPEWRRFLRVVTRRIAECGYDGLFVDNCILHSYDKFSQKRFERFLLSKYRRQDWKKLLGITDCQARLYDPQRGDSQTPYNYSVDSGRPAARDFSPREALLWAETQRFWADSIVEQIGEMKAEGAQARGRPFLVVANWGPMYRTTAVNSRRQDAKDVAKYARICDGIMYEDELDMGRLADGVYNDNILQYRYSLALGACPVELPYVRPIESLLELGLAECWAAGGGSFCWASFQFTDIRGRYARFTREHPELYAGLTSYSQVGLCFFFDQLYFENIAHLREVYRLSRYLLDRGYLFDFVAESACRPDTLRRWKTVIVPRITHMSDQQKEAITQYARDGGTVVIVGPCANRTETGQPRAYGADDPFGLVANALETSSYGSIPCQRGMIIYGRNLEDLLPVGWTSFDDLKNFYFETGDLFPEDRKPRGQELMARAAHSFHVDRFTARGGRLADMWDQVPSGPSSVFPGDPIPGLRASAFLSDDGRRLVLHLVNYNVPINGDDHTPEPVRDVSLSVPIPDGKRAVSALCLGPEASEAIQLDLARSRPPRETQKAPGAEREGRTNAVITVVPEVRIYRVIELLLD